MSTLQENCTEMDSVLSGIQLISTKGNLLQRLGSFSALGCLCVSVSEAHVHFPSKEGRGMEGRGTRETVLPQ